MRRCRAHCCRRRRQHAAANDDTAFDSDEDDEHVHNPLKLPLGWDGKPIPYWLFKLHGLDKEFSCEICGGALVPRQARVRAPLPRDQARHGHARAGDPQHQGVLRGDADRGRAGAVGDAAGEEGGGGGGGGGVVGDWQGAAAGPLQAAVSHRAATNAAVAADEVEEVEDEEGNVYDRRTYEDLKQQGVL